MPSRRNSDSFNFWFSVLLLAGMVVIAVINFLFKIHDDGVNMAMQILAGAGAIMGVTNTVLSANGSIWTFLFGIIDVTIGAVVCYDSGIMGNFALHAFYFLPMQFVGFWQWRKRGATAQKKVSARKLTARQWLYLGLAFVGGVAITFTILLLVDKAKFNSGAIMEINTSKLFLDSSVMVLNILGQVLLSMAFAEQWYIWNLVNIFSILLWTNRLMSPEATGYTVVMVVKYVLYFLNSLNGLRIWKRFLR